MRKFGSMRGWMAGMAVATGAMLASQTAMASGSNVTVTGTGGTAQADVTLSVTLSSAIVLTIAGKSSAPSSTMTGGTDATNATGTGTIDFGAMNTACSPASSTGGVCERLSDNTGARMVATIDATVTVSGSAAGTSKLGIQAPAAAAPLGARYYRVCAGACDTASTDTYWKSPTCGGTCNAIPVATLGSEIGAAIASGSSVEHQIALQYADTAAAGASTLVVSYVAVPN